MDRNGPLSRTSSIQSDSGPLELGSDTSPLTSSPHDSLADINVGMLQNGKDIQLSDCVVSF